MDMLAKSSQTLPNTRSLDNNQIIPTNPDGLFLPFCDNYHWLFRRSIKRCGEPLSDVLKPVKRNRVNESNSSIKNE